MKKLIVLVLLVLLVSCSAVDNNNTLKGVYSYIADAAIFTDCKTQNKYPVAFEGDNIALEEAYLKTVKNSGDKIFVTLLGHFEKRPKMDGKDSVDFLIVDKFEKIQLDKNCKR